MTDDRAEDLTKSSTDDPPAANQAKDEPIAAAPARSAQSSDGDAGARDAGAADTADAATMPASATGGVPTPGDSKGVAVPSVQAAAGTSEEAEPLQGVKTTLAPPGKPDGEVDTRA